MLRRLKYDSRYTAGNDVHFKMLKFPYKILEDVSRNFQIQQQPNSQENVNNLINSTGFCSNDSSVIGLLIQAADGRDFGTGTFCRVFLFDFLWVLRYM